MSRNRDVKHSKVLLSLAFVLLSSVAFEARAFQAPQINVPSTINGIVGEVLSIPVTATGSPAPIVVALDLPLGLNLTAGILGGTPTQPGQKNITILATNLLGTDLKVVTINVTNPLGTLPSITSLLNQNGTVGQPLNHVLTSTGTGPVTYVAQNLPAGLALVGDTISGTPTTDGEFDVSISATNVVGIDAKILHLSISLAGAPATYTGLTDATGTVGLMFNQVLTATGTVPLNYNVTNLPAGLTFSGNIISGIPQATGLFSINISVSNGISTDIKILNLAVVELVKPTITSPLSVSLGSNDTLNYTITASGTQPISFAAANLPSGVTLNGAVLSGNPAVSGTYNVTLAANNVAGQDIKTLVLAVAVVSGTPGDEDGTPYIGSLDTDGDGIPNDQDPDDDNDGFPDGIEEAAGSDPLDPNSTPTGGSNAGLPQNLNVRKMSIGLNFAKSQSDSIQLQGTFAVPSNFTLNTQKLVVDIGGVAKMFTLNAKGLAKDGTSQAQVKISKSKKVKNNQNAKYALKLQKGDWQTKLAKYGLTNDNAKKVEKNIPVAVMFNSTIYSKTQIQFYSAKKGHSGKTK